MPRGICNKCGEGKELVLVTYTKTEPISGVCATCSDSLDKQWAGSTATDWVLTWLEDSRVMEHVYLNTRYAQMKAYWVAHVPGVARGFWRFRQATREEIARPIIIRPAAPEEVTSYLQNCREWEIATETDRIILETCEKLGIQMKVYWEPAEAGEQEEPHRVQAAEEISGRLRQLGWIEELARMKRDDSNAFQSIEDARLLEMVLQKQADGLTRTVSSDSVANEQPNSGRGLSRVAGMTELKEQLTHDVIRPFEDPELYRRYRVTLPNGILFYGPPGCGKTYLARSLAEELGWHFQYCRPSDVASPYIHDTVNRIRAVFAAALEKAPSIIFIDEFEAFVPARSELGGHQQYKAEEVNEFLANLEGCAERKVLVIAATNEPDKIDPAVRRSGRFDKLILIPPPDAEARRAMLEFHLQGRPVDASLDIAGIAAVLDGYSASDIKLLVDEAARMALKRKDLIETTTLLAALERVPASITSEDMQRYYGFRSRGSG
jgi:transitional endoplasmic reticulum ATPase